MDAIRDRLSILVGRLNSKSLTEARLVASELDTILWPSRDGLPRIITYDRWKEVEEEHFRKLRGTDLLLPLFDTLRSGSVFGRNYAISYLDSVGDERLLPFLVQALTDPVPSIRSEAARCTMITRIPQIKSLLIELLRDDDIEVMQSASCSLGRMRAVEAVEPLMALAHSGNWHHRQYALWALGDILEPKVLPVLRGALRDKHNAVRKAAKTALAAFDMARRAQANVPKA